MLRKRYSELMKLFVKHNNFKSKDEFIDLFCAFIYGEFSTFTDGEVVYIDEDDELEEDEKIKAKINVISKLNPYYKNEIESFK